MDSFVARARLIATVASSVGFVAVPLACIGLFGLVTVLACWLPAGRAAQIDPVAALRAD